MGRIALIRHGQTGWSLSGRHTSVTDIDLTEYGVRQAARIPAILEALEIDPHQVLVSPRLRARRTAELAGLPATEVDQDLAEWAYGEYEGLKTPEIRQSNPGWQIFDDGAPGGETVEQVRVRVDRVLARAAALLDGGDVALVCHGHISRVLAVRWAGMPVATGRCISLDPAAVTVLGSHHDEPVIERANFFLPLEA